MILDKINTPEDLKKLPKEELSVLCEELKHFIYKNTSAKEGHIRSSIGVTELTVALHRVYNTPHDILIWDVGHQAYVHKILTARKDLFKTNRLRGGLSGFTKRSESVYDPFGAGHSSTSISAAVGFAMAEKLRGGNRKHVAVIGDGAITGGMSFEALNYLGEQQLDVLIILNDNGSSIDENVGALAQKKSYEKYCASLGIKYFGKVDGQDVESLIERMEEVRELKVPVMLRVLTRKPEKKGESSAKKAEVNFQDVFSNTLIELAEQNDKIVAITPAMLSGSGLDKFSQRFPDRTFDVGIAEQHAVTMAAGLAADGFIPVVHLYSTFSQRAFDQIVHDVALQGLHVVFCLDRAGLVGEDGATHHGNFDPGFLNTIPGLTIAAPLDGSPLENLLAQAIAGDGPWVLRYPKSECRISDGRKPITSFKALELKQGREKAVLSFGAIGSNVALAVEKTLFAHFDFPFLKPLDHECLLRIAAEFDEVITAEENSLPGGLGDAVRAFFASRKISIAVRSIGLPDRFIEHGSREELLQLTGLDPASIQKFIEN